MTFSDSRTAAQAQRTKHNKKTQLNISWVSRFKGETGVDYAGNKSQMRCSHVIKFRPDGEAA